MGGSLVRLSGPHLEAVRAAAAADTVSPLPLLGSRTLWLPDPPTLPPPLAAFLTFFVSFIFNDVAAATTVTRRGKIVSPLCPKQQVSTTLGKGKPLSSPCPLPRPRALEGAQDY